MDERKSHEETRPITLFVSRIGTEVPDLKHMKTQRVTVIDVEISNQDAKVLMDLLREHLDKSVPGTMRYRMYGNLVLG